MCLVIAVTAKSIELITEFDLSLPVCGQSFFILLSQIPPKFHEIPPNSVPSEIEAPCPTRNICENFSSFAQYRKLKGQFDVRKQDLDACNSTFKDGRNTNYFASMAVKKAMRAGL